MISTHQAPLMGIWSLHKDVKMDFFYVFWSLTNDFLAGEGGLGKGPFVSLHKDVNMDLFYVFWGGFLC